MNIKNISLYLLYGLLIFGIYGSSSLSYNNAITPGTCPSISVIPACYIILACFIGLLVIHVAKIKNIYFYLLAIFPISIALYGTTFQIFGGVECPKTGSGIPMCFISLFMFSSIVLCKYLTSTKK